MHFLSWGKLFPVLLYISAEGTSYPQKAIMCAARFCIFWSLMQDRDLVPTPEILYQYSVDTSGSKRHVIQLTF